MPQKKASLLFKNTPLNDVIVKLETKFDIKLSFNSELITNQTITFNSVDATLEEAIIAIEEQTNVEFEKVTERYYIIKQQAKLDLSKTQNLDEVIISEYLTSGINKKGDGSIKLSPSSLGILPGLTEPDVLQSLQLLPGVQSPTETASGLYVRGGTPDQNLILWDGIKMYHSGHFFGMISAFNPYITKDIKLYSSGTRAKYGSRISSVIDIISSNNIPETIKGGGGFNLTHADLYLKMPLSEKVAIIASARRSFSDAVESITFKNISKKVFQNTRIQRGNKIYGEDDIRTINDLFYFSDVTLKTIIKPSEKDEISFSNLFTTNKLDNSFDIEGISLFVNDKLDIKNRGSSVLWNHNSSDKFMYSLQAYASNFELDYSGRNIAEGAFKDESIRQNTVEDLGLSFNTNWQISKANSLGLGYQLSSQKIGYLFKIEYQNEGEEIQFYDFEDKTQNNTHSVFADYQYKNGNKFHLDAGLRVNYISAFKRFYYEPRIHLQTRLAPHLKFNFSVEKLHQSVSQIVEFIDEDFKLGNQTWVLADGDNIPVLESFQLTSGLGFSNNGWTIDVDGYLKKIKGLSSLTRGFDNANNFSFLSGESDVLGLDVLIKKKINNYRTWLSYSLINNKFTFDGINQGNQFPGNFDITHQVSWSHSYVWNNFNFSLGWNLRTGTPYTKALGLIEDEDGNASINYSKINGDRLPSYNRLDFSTTYKFNFSERKKWKGKIGLSVLNITNKKNLLGKSYRVTSIFNGENIENTLQERNRFSLGITPNIVFRVAF